MKIKSAIAGIIVATTMIAVVPSQAAQVCTDSTCGVWTVPAGFSGTGWGMVPCGSDVRPAISWQEYSSGHYAPPQTGRDTLWSSGQ